MAEAIIRGYRGRVGDVPALLADLRASGMRVQLMRASLVYGRDHLRLAALLAARAVDGGRARSADLQTETLLYAAGERQVGRAITKMGLAPDVEQVAAVVWAADEGTALDAWAAARGWVRDDGVLEGTDEALDALGVSDAERRLIPRERWGDLVLEKVALVDVAKP